jgi:hypothetical protein
MSRVRDLASILTASSSMATDAEVSAVSAQIPTNVAGKNLIINGGFDFSQRGTGAFSGGGYTLDRWSFLNFGTAGNSSTVQLRTDAAQVGFTNYARISSGSTTVTNFIFSQSLETSEVRRLQGRSVTVSFRYKIPAGWSTLWDVSVYTSTNIDQNISSFAASGATSAGAKQLSNPTTWTSDSITFTVPSNATSLSVAFNNFNNILSTSQLDIAQVQLEIGSVATPFSRAGGDIQGELAKCQRYYQRWNFTNNGDHLGNGQASGSSSVRRVNWPTKVIMRANPSIPTHTGTIVCYKADGSGVNLTSLGYNGSTPDRISVDFGTSASAGTAGDYIFVLLNNGAYFEASAEL